MDKEEFMNSLSEGMVVLGGCGTVGSLIARILACHNIDVTIIDSAPDSYLTPIFKKEGINLKLGEELDNDSFKGKSAIFVAPSLLKNDYFTTKLNNFNKKNLPVYSIEEIIKFFLPNKPVIGVTGTNGKTTTTHTIKHIFKINNYKVPEHGLRIQGNSEFIPALQARLDGDLAVLEIGTFGRKGEIKRSATNSHVNMGVITNITRDHLNNGTFEDYINCKKEMVEVADTLILDGDDPLLASIGSKHPEKEIHYFGIKDGDNDLFKSKYNNRHCPSCGKLLNYNISYLRNLGEYECECGFKNPKLDVYATNIRIIKEGNTTKTKYTIHFVDETRDITLKNSGVHNVYNSLGSACAAWVQGLDINSIVRGLETFNGVPGRLEYIHNNPTMIMDYAHNPAGVETTLNTVLKLKTEHNRIIVLNTISSESGKEGDIDIAKLLSKADIVIPVSTSSTKVVDYIDTHVVPIRSNIKFNKTGTTGSSPEQVTEGIRLALKIAEDNDIILSIGEAGVKYSKSSLNKILFENVKKQ
ncbi:Mur ligase family protein [Methanobrevibacter sp. 87.7]|uniref:Mur ligase family protein n=1 Tax=Methanobrevibacter sp. 87.7 TaxID=387957 RepID=UPI001E3AD72E|nr:Mur ligase family protein [Methanobrevibacter sp. 87.7]